MMTENFSEVPISDLEDPVPEQNLRRRRLRRNTRRRSSDVIVVDSPLQAESSRAPRRRRGLHDNNDAQNDSIVDLTCASPDEIVDLTSSPDFIPREVPILEISDNETELDQSLDTPTEPSPLSALSCPVCLEKFSKIVRKGGQITSTICGHVFCKVCISTAVFHSKKCPTCRKKLDAKKIHTLYLPV